VLLPLVAAFPRLDARQSQTTVCGQYDTVQWGSYSLLTDLWGLSGATGSQCSTINSVNNNVVDWSTTYSWSGKTSIVSYSNIQLNTGVNQQLSAITSMPSQWTWTQSTESVVADVAYDFFTSDTSGGSDAVEIMIWLANIQAGPISSQYNSDGEPVPIASSVDINGKNWNVYYGVNGHDVYSFLPTGGNIGSWSGDMYEFFSYLIDNGHISSSQYLKTAQAGTEVTSGSATFTTSAYSLAIN